LEKSKDLLKEPKKNKNEERPRLFLAETSTSYDGTLKVKVNHKDVFVVKCMTFFTKFYLRESRVRNVFISTS